MSTDRPAGGGGPLRRGLRGSLDLPRQTIADAAAVNVGGWVFHEHARVLLVVVLVDGRIVGTVERELPRPDVGAAYPGAGDRSGWSAVLDLGRVGSRVTLSAHALVMASETEGQPPRTVLLPFAERTLDVVGGRLVRGEVVLPEGVTASTLAVSGTADILPALARVEVSINGATPVVARNSLPSSADRVTGVQGCLRGFSVTLELPSGVRTLDVRVTAVATDGTRADLQGASLAVRQPEEDPDADERQHVQDQRLAEHLDALRVSCPPGRRILVAAHDLGIGGAQGYLDDLMQGLHYRGVEFCVVAGGDGPLLEHIESAYGAPVLVVGQVPEGPELLQARIRQIAGFAVEYGAAACLANTLVAFPAVLAAARLGIPVAWAIHESFAPAIFWHEYLGRPAHPEILAATLRALASSDDVLFVAESTRQLFREHIPDAASSTVPYGLDITAIDRTLATTRREAARAELGIALDRRVLVCVGSVEPRKGQLSLARAFARLGSQGEQASLYVVGATDTSYTRALRDFVRDAGLDNVHIIDSDPDIMRWYVAADVLVSAADVESMPRTMLEAMVAGRPVAAVAAFGVAELVDEGVSGWLCPPGDVAELTGLLRRVITAGDAQLTSMGAAGRAYVEAHHAASGYIDHVAARLRRWLEEDPT